MMDQQQNEELLASLAARRQPMPDIQGLQVQLTRYKGSLENVPGGWHNHQRSPAAGVPSDCVPTSMMFTLVEAPAEWMWPIRTDKCFKPGFKLALDISHSKVMDLSIQLQVLLLTDEAQQRITTWAPVDCQTSVAALKGTTQRSVIIEAGKMDGWASGGFQHHHHQQQANGSHGDGMTTREELVFSDLRFAKPSRMAPVYIAFTCTLQATGDTLITLYKVPTVCICRAEQWPTACGRLHVTATLPSPTDHNQPVGPVGLQTLSSQSIPTQAPGCDAQQLSQQEPSIHAGVSGAGVSGAGGAHLPQHHKTTTSWPATHHSLPMNMPQRSTAAGAKRLSEGMWVMSGTSPGSGQAQPSSAAGNLMAQEVMDWCLERFNAAGFVRGLLAEDLQTLATISGARAESAQEVARFKIKFESLLSFLKRIPQLWNTQNPCVIAGPMYTRALVSHRLQGEPPGTFVCRLSLSSSSPGLALAAKMPPGQLPSQHGSTEGVIHVLITAADIDKQPVQTILRDQVGTTHLLDVYSNKRLDKRKVFASDYMRLGDMLKSHTADTRQAVQEAGGSRSNGHPPPLQHNQHPQHHQHQQPRLLHSTPALNSPPTDGNKTLLPVPGPPPHRAYNNMHDGGSTGGPGALGMPPYSALHSAVQGVQGGNLMVQEMAARLQAASEAAKPNTGASSAPGSTVPNFNLIDNGTLDVNMLLDSGPVNGGQPIWGQACGDASTLLNSDEQMMAAALLGD